MSPLRHIPQRLQHWIVPYILILLTLTAIGVVVTFRVQTERDSAQAAEARSALRHAAIDNCRRSNEVRRVARAAVVTLASVQIDGLKQEIDSSRAVPPKFFPGIPPARFRALIQAQNHDRRVSIRALQSVQESARESFHATDCLATNPAP